MTEPLTITMTQQAAFDGEPAKVVELKNNTGMSVSFMDIGATWLSCRLPLVNGELREEVLLGVGTMGSFMHQQCYMGVTVGRYANRIANGLFEVDGEAFQVSTNQAGNCLHGGEEGFDKRRWNIESQSEQQVTFSLLSEDGDQGFPGNLEVHVTYTLTDDNQVSIAYFAKTDKATPVNLTNHAYFNLLGAEADLDCRSHRLTIAADQYLPTNEVGIPLGTLQDVRKEQALILEMKSQYRSISYKMSSRLQRKVMTTAIYLMLIATFQNPLPGWFLRMEKCICLS